MTTFYKYQGAGNDFILLDDRDNQLHELFDRATIALWCDRHFGIGADGLMFLRHHPDYDFEMIYYNADGAPSSLCGNGARCIVRFANDRGLERAEYRFLAADGPHRAALLADGTVSLEMLDVAAVTETGDGFVLDTGSPHYVTFVADSAAVDVMTQGRAVRNSADYAEEGINVNFVDGDTGGLRIATYERGVERETLACGTGVTAAAIAAVRREGRREGMFHVPVRAKGGALAVVGRVKDGLYQDLRLRGPAEFVFAGRMHLG